MGIFPFVFSLVHRLVCRAVSSHYYKWCYLRFLDKAEEEINVGCDTAQVSIIMKKFAKSGKFYAYIVQCQDGTYYAGYTNDLDARIKLHNNGRGAKYTRDRRPVSLAWSKEYKYFKRAFLEEKRIKRLTRVQKEKLVKNDQNSK